MAWITVTIKQPKTFNRPDICPNCLDSPANAPVKLYRSIGIPFLASSTTKGQWWFCNSCAKMHRSADQLRWRYGVAPGLLIVTLALVMAIINANGSSKLPAFWVLLIGLLVAIFGSLVATIANACKAKPSTCLSKSPTVKPVSSNQSFTGTMTSATYRFAHPVYVEQIAELNPPAIVKIDRKKLVTAMKIFEKKHVS